MDLAGFKFIVGAAVMAMSCTSIAADKATFEGTAWRIAAINDEATPANYYLSFTDGSVGGRVGCNDFGGRFEVAANELNVRALRATSRICGDAAAAFEGGLMIVLTHPMRLEWDSARRVSLVNGNGSIKIERMP